MSLIKVTPDKKRAKSILDMTNLIQSRINAVDKDKFSSLIIVDYYEIIKKLRGIING